MFFQLTATDVGGEFIRRNVIESEKGVVLHMDIQVIDFNTCTPIPKAAVEIWGANATVCAKHPLVVML
jgi:protocatechuate 3,4-dioxygenase beta subunit